MMEPLIKVRKLMLYSLYVYLSLLFLVLTESCFSFRRVHNFFWKLYSKVPRNYPSVVPTLLKQELK